MRMTFLSENEINDIHKTSIRILENIGVKVPHGKMRDFLREHGGEVDHDTTVVKIPEKLVMDSIEMSGKQFTIYGRNKDKTAAFGQGKRNYNSIGGEASWLDDETGKRRFAKFSDLKTATLISDNLSNITIAGAMVDAIDVPVEVRCIETCVEQLRYTHKPIHFFYYDRKSARYINELLLTLRGSEEEAEKFPAFYPFFEPISPLSFPFEGIDLLFETKKYNLPVSIGPMAQVGMSAPMTLAGTIAQENAEILAGITMVQIVNPGNAVCYGSIPHAFDMRTTQMVFSGPEQALMAGALTQVGKHYGLPVYINVGLTDSKVVDAQAGLEAGMTLLYGAMAGADIFGHMGICGVDQATSLDILVMQNEIIAYVERIMKGFEVNEKTLAYDVIHDVGPGGSFIATMHTADNFRKTLWFPELLDREFYENWESKGKSTMADRCRDKKEKILKEHTVEPLPDDIEKEFQKIIKSARKELLSV